MVTVVGDPAALPTLHEYSQSSNGYLLPKTEDNENEQCADPASNAAYIQLKVTV